MMQEELIENKMRLLCAECESDIVPVAGRERGSRMIGVEHDDSDWDAFLLFAQPAEKYAMLSGYKDTVSRKFMDGDIDIHGWNVRKLAKLGTDSNPNAIEFLFSDETYFNDLNDSADPMHTERDLLAELREDAAENFNHMALYNHYLSLARSNYEKYVASGNDCTYNRQFYVMRATMMAKHIRVEGSFPRLDVWEFANQTDCLTTDEESLLVDLSRKKSLGHLGEASDLVGMYLEREDAAEMEPTDERIREPSRELYDELIRAAIV
jgi:predicted nucleotidyltransferase